MSIQQLPREILYNICQYLVAEDIVDFQKVLPEVLHCGIFPDEKKRIAHVRKEAKKRYENTVGIFKRYQFCKVRVIESEDSLHSKKILLKLYNEKIHTVVFKELEYFFRMKEFLRKRYNLLAQVMNLVEIEEEVEICPSCGKLNLGFQDFWWHLKFDYPHCFEFFSQYW